MSFRTPQRSSVAQPPTRSRRLRRGLIALGIAAALPAAVTTSQAAAKYDVGHQSTVVGGCAYSGSSSPRGTVMNYNGPYSADFWPDHTYICGEDAEGDGSHWVDLGETYHP